MQTDKALEKFTRSNSTEKPVYGANLLGKSPLVSEIAKEDLTYTLNEEQPIVSNTDCEADSIISGISRTVGYSNIEEKSVPLNESSLPPSTTVEEKINRSENFNVAIKQENKTGISVPVETVDNYDVVQPKSSNVNVSRTKHFLTEKAANVAKKEGFAEELQNVEEFAESNPKSEKTEVKNVKSQSTELAKLVDNSVGVYDKEEIPEHFSEKFQAKTKTPKISKEKGKEMEKIKFKSFDLSFYPEQEEAKECVEELPVQKSSNFKSTKNVITEMAEKTSKQVGQVIEPDETNSFVESVTNPKIASIKKTRSKSTERVMFESKDIGTEEESHTCEQFEKENTMLPSQASSNFVYIDKAVSSNTTVQIGTSNKQDEVTDVSFGKPESKQLKVSKYRSESSERAIKRPQLLGDEDELSEEFTGKFEPKQSNAITLEEVSKITEKPINISRNIGSHQPESEANYFKPEDFKSITVDPVPQDKYINKSSMLQPKNVGILQNIEETQLIEEQKFTNTEPNILEEDTNKDILLNIPRDVGFKTADLETDTLAELVLHQEVAIENKNVSSTDYVNRTEKTVGTLVPKENTSDLPIQSAIEEYANPLKEKEADFYTKTTNTIGFEPLEGSVSDIVEDYNPIENLASETKTRSKSGQRSTQNSFSLGFHPNDSVLEDIPLKVNSTAQASSLKQKAISEKVEKIGHSGGFINKYDDVSSLPDSNNEEKQISENVEANRITKRASSHGRTIGYEPPIEKVEEKSIFIHDKQVADIKSTTAEGRRATSQIRVEGFKPLLEESNDYEDTKNLKQKIQKPEKSVHRVSRSRAAKRVTKHGESTKEETTKILNPLEGHEILNEPIYVEGIDYSFADSYTPVLLSAKDQSTDLDKQTELDIQNAESKIDLQQKDVKEEKSKLKETDLAEINIQEAAEMKTNEELQESIVNAEKKSHLSNKKKKRNVSKSYINNEGKTASAEFIDQSQESEEELQNTLADVVDETKSKQLVEDIPELSLKDEYKEKIIPNETLSSDVNEENAVLGSEKSKELRITKDKKKVTQESNNESEMKENVFPFGKKLKKAETVKLKIKESKLELPNLKHHEFENIPKDIEEEQLSSIKLSNLIKIDDKESKVKQEEIKRKIKKKKAKLPVQEAVEPMEIDGDTSLTEELVSDQISEKFLDDIPVSNKVEDNEQDVSLKASLDEIQIDEMNNISIKEIAADESDTSSKVEMTKMKPKQKEVPNKNIEETFPFGKKLKKAETVKLEIKSSSLEKIQLKHHDFENEPQKNSDEEGSIIRLGKPIESINKDKDLKLKKKVNKKLVPRSKDNDIVDCPEGINTEEASEEFEEDIQIPELSKEKEKIPKYKDTSYDKDLESEKIPETKLEDIPISDTVEEVARKDDSVKAPVDEIKTDKIIHVSHAEEEDKTSSKVGKTKLKPKQKEVPKENKEESFPFVKKLKKAETVKLEIKPSSLEKIQLKHHDFENEPQKNGDEEISIVRLGKPIESIDKDRNLKLKRKVKKKLPKSKDKDIVNSPEEIDIEEATEEFEEDIQSPELPKETAKISKSKDHGTAMKTATQIGFSPNEERTSRKERDPIVTPAAAIPKKHSDIEKVELPAYLNYPSDQGIIMPEDEVENSSLEARPIPMITESVHEDSQSKSPIIENQVMTRTSKQKKKIPKKDDEFINIPIVVEGSKDSIESVTIKTVTENQVCAFLFPFCFSNHCHSQ